MAQRLRCRHSASALWEKLSRRDSLTPANESDHSPPFAFHLATEGRILHKKKIKWLALMICCFKESHHKAPATFASIHFCFQSSASGLSAFSFLRPTFYIQPFCIQPSAFSFLHPTFCGQPSTSGLLNPAFTSSLLHPASYIQRLLLQAILYTICAVH